MHICGALIMTDVRDLLQANFLNDMGNGIATFEYDADGKAIYIGYAEPGSSKAVARWQIRKLTYDGMLVVDIQFAGGSAEFNKVWNDRASYDYS